MVASKMLLFDRRDTLHTAGDYVTPDRLAHNRGGVGTKTPPGQFCPRGLRLQRLWGSAALSRDDVGPDRVIGRGDFFFSFEDIDLAWQAQLAGWRCVFEPRAIVYHKLKASGGGTAASFYDEGAATRNPTLVSSPRRPVARPSGRGHRRGDPE